MNRALRLQARAVISRLRQRLPGAIEAGLRQLLNALAIGFGPSDRASEVIISIAVYPRWVSLFFLQAREAP